LGESGNQHVVEVVESNSQAAREAVS
jgi:hypothetical protein